MKLARYIGGGKIEIRDEPVPEIAEGGILVKTEACGLCSGELMDWYMERKIPHVLGHEVCARVVESQDDRFAVGSRVFAHHHAPCLSCEFCCSGSHVHCATWKRTRLRPGGMAEYFAVDPDNLTDAYIVDDIDSTDAALIEPLACVAKSVRRSRYQPGESVAVIGLGVMGLMHQLVIGIDAGGYETNPKRAAWAERVGTNVHQSAREPVDVVFVCPGTESAVNFGISIAKPGGRIVLFAPFSPSDPPTVAWDAVYFRDLELISSFSCGPDDCVQAIEWLRSGRVSAKQVVSDFIGIDDLPGAYLRMKSGEILKAMVQF